MTIITGTAEVKARLSELLGRVRHGRERVIITRRGKPVAALVSIDDLRRIGYSEEPGAEITLVEKDGILVLHADAQDSLEDIVIRDRHRRDAQLQEQAGA